MYAIILNFIATIMCEYEKIIRKPYVPLELHMHKITVCIFIQNSGVRVSL